MERIYENWTTEEIKNAIWSLNNSMSIPGGRGDIEELRNELRFRGLEPKGYHE